MNGPWRSGSTRDSSLLLQKAANEALESAALDFSAPFRLGVCIGTTSGCALHFLDDYRRIGKIPGQASPFNGQNRGEVRTGEYRAVDDFYRHCMAFDLAGELLAKHPTLRPGPLLTVSNACTSGADAIGLAAQWIRQGLCEVAVAGGTDALSLVPYIGFDKLMVYSQEPCRPFDVERDGLNLGEGAGLLVLESTEHAARRGAKTLGLFRGYGASSDAYHLTAPHPQGRGLRAAIRMALDDAVTTEDATAFVNAHGTATRENDKAEGLVYSELFPAAALWASKGVTGHCLGAAGAIEAVLTVSALRQKEIPASFGCAQPEETVVRQLTREATRIDGNLALSVSIGFGGGNAVLVFAAPEPSGSNRGAK